jgi:hypothetical protein
LSPFFGASAWSAALLPSALTCASKRAQPWTPVMFREIRIGARDGRFGHLTCTVVGCRQLERKRKRKRCVGLCRRLGGRRKPQTSIPPPIKAAPPPMAVARPPRSPMPTRALATATATTAPLPRQALHRVHTLPRVPRPPSRPASCRNRIDWGGICSGMSSTPLAAAGRLLVPNPCWSRGFAQVRRTPYVCCCPSSTWGTGLGRLLVLGGV